MCIRDSAKDMGLELGETGAIKVDHNYRTSDPDIYAVGDAIQVFNRLTRKPSRLALAGPAQRQARAAADHMYGIPHNNKGEMCIRDRMRMHWPVKRMRLVLSTVTSSSPSSI